MKLRQLTLKQLRRLTLKQPSRTKSNVSSTFFNRALIIIANHKLTEDNYLSWERDVEMFITCKDKTISLEIFKTQLQDIK